MGLRYRMRNSLYFKSYKLIAGDKLQKQKCTMYMNVDDVAVVVLVYQSAGLSYSSASSPFSLASPSSSGSFLESLAGCFFASS